MSSFSNILTLAESRTSDLVSIKKSIILAKKSQGHVTVLSTRNKPSSYHRWLNKTENNICYNNEKIEKLVSIAKREGVAIDYEMREEKDQFTAIKRQLENNQYDLIVSEHRKEEPKLWSFDSAEYSRLMNVSDTSVLFVGDHQWRDNGNILAAIETEENTINHHTFNDEIIVQSNIIAKLLMSNIHLFNCYLENCSISFSEDIPTLEFAQHLEHLTSLVKAHHLEDKYLHVEEGLADDVIPTQANKFDANVVVIGCGEHKGWLSKIKGHTVDYVLENLECDLLALKQSIVH
jgi:nucleotide-binding universal stress UspA family protein